MKVWKLAVLSFLVLLLGGIGQSQAENNAPVNLSFQGITVKSEDNLLVKNKINYVSLNFVMKYLPVTAIWRTDTGEVRLKTGLNTYELQEEQLNYRVGNTVKQLDTPPFKQGGQLWLPVTFLTTELGIAVQNDDGQSLALGWAGNYLVGIESVTYQGRPALALVGMKPFQYNSFVLHEPERLVVELSDIKAYPGLNTTNVSFPMLQKVRFSQFQTDTLRLVCDLKQQCGYRIIDDPQNANRVLVVFNYVVQTVNFFKQDEAERIQIKTDYPAVYTVTQLSRPLRAVIDLDGATLADPQLTVNGKGKYFKKVRISQYNPQTVRIVLDLADANWPYRVMPLRKDATILEARNVQTVRNIDCLESDPGLTKLVVTGSGELDKQVRKLKNPSRLQIDLDFFKFAAQLQKPFIDQLSQVKGIRLLTLSPTSVRIEAELNYVAGYEVKMSEDYQQFVISLIKSPIIDKTLVLDPGHGGEDNGAKGKQGTREKNVNLEVSLRLKELLAEAGANVILTRTDDHFISLYERDFIANQARSDLFVSVHTNFHPNPNVHGIEVYSYKGMADSTLLAKEVEMEMVKETKLTGLGVKNNDFVVIREALMPSILVELGYLSYGPEEAVIRTDEFKNQAALGIYRGIIDYYHAK